MRLLACVLLCMFSVVAVGQDADSDAAPEMAPPGMAAPASDATTLETLVVTAPPLQMEDLYRFRNPVEVDPSSFNRAWHEKQSLEEIGMNGGIVPILVGMAARQVHKGARKIPGWKEPVQAAVARPPPLSEEQAARALRLQEAGEP